LASTFGAQRGVEVGELALLEIGRDHGRAFGDERPRDRPPDALPGRGDERNFAFQSIGHGTPP
jgi:hypothetical protein